MKKNLRILICWVVFCIIVACSESASTKDASINSPLSPMSTAPKLLNNAAIAFQLLSSKDTNLNNQHNQKSQNYLLLGQSSIFPHLITSIFALHKNIFPLDKSGSDWQPGILLSLDSSNNPKDGGIISNYNFKQDPNSYFIGRTGEKLYPQILTRGAQVVASMRVATTSVGVQFMCKQSCGWAQIRVDGEVRWIGNVYNMDDYVEIYELPYGYHDVIVESLGRSGGIGSNGEVRIMAFGAGVLHRIYLPIVLK